MHSTLIRYPCYDRLLMLDSPDLSEPGFRVSGSGCWPLAKGSLARELSGVLLGPYNVSCLSADLDPLPKTLLHVIVERILCKTLALNSMNIWLAYVCFSIPITSEESFQDPQICLSSFSSLFCLSPFLGRGPVKDWFWGPFIGFRALGLGLGLSRIPFVPYSLSNKPCEITPCCTCTS